jgi:hypothetical protein
MLNKLADFQDPFIIRYQVGGKRYIQVVKSGSHFHPHPNENKSQIPSHPPSTLQPKVEVLQPKAEALGLVVDVRKSVPSEAPILKSESLSSAKPPAAKAAVFDFEVVWARYPRKLGKDEAARHFKAQVTTTKDFLDIQHALDRFKSKLQKDATEERFIPHGSTWFNKRWRDWINYTEESHAPNGSARNLNDTDLARRALEAQGLRKVGDGGAAGKIFDRFRDGTMHEEPAKKPE